MVIKYLKNIISTNILEDLVNIISKYIIAEAKQIDEKLYNNIQALNNNDILHSGIQLLRQHNPESVTKIIESLSYKETVFNSFLASICLHENILETARLLTNAKSIYDLSMSGLALKVFFPNNNFENDVKFMLPWHQESSYFSHIENNDSIAFWIPLFDCNEEGGCLHVIPKSNNLGQLNHEEMYSDKVNNKHLRKYIPNDKFNEDEKKIVEMNRGDVLAFSFNTIHKNGLNTSNKVRYTLIIRATKTLL